MLERTSSRFTMLAGFHMVAIISANLLFLPALIRCCSSHLCECGECIANDSKVSFLITETHGLHGLLDEPRDCECNSSAML